MVPSITKRRQVYHMIKKTRLGSHFSELDLIKIETNELFLQLEQLNK